MVIAQLVLRLVHRQPLVLCVNDFSFLNHGIINRVATGQRTPSMLAVRNERVAELARRENGSLSKSLL